MKKQPLLVREYSQTVHLIKGQYVKLEGLVKKWGMDGSNRHFSKDGDELRDALN